MARVRSRPLASTCDAVRLLVEAQTAASSHSAASAATSAKSTPRLVGEHADDAVHRAGVDVAQPQRLREPPAHGALAGTRRAVDGDDECARHRAQRLEAGEEVGKGLRRRSRDRRSRRPARAGRRARRPWRCDDRRRWRRAPACSGDGQTLRPSARSSTRAPSRAQLGGDGAQAIALLPAQVRDVADVHRRARERRQRRQRRRGVGERVQVGVDAVELRRSARR